MSFTYTRTIRLADTDAAGVVYFARTLSLCHEAYEEALTTTGIRLGELLGGNDIVVPIAKSEAEYLRPLKPGDSVKIVLKPVRLTDASFEIRYEVYRRGTPEKLAAKVRTEHVCTSPSKRARVAIPEKLAAWVDRKTA